MKTGKLSPFIGSFPTFSRPHSPRLPLLFITEQFCDHLFPHGIGGIIEPLLYYSQLLVVIMCSVSPPGDLCDPGLSDLATFREKAVLGRIVQSLDHSSALWTESINDLEQLPGLEQASSERSLHSVNVYLSLPSVFYLFTLTFHISRLNVASLPPIKINEWVLSLVKILSENQPLSPGSTIQYLCEII